MTIQEIHDKCEETAIYPKQNEIDYLILGLIGEAGELANKRKKQLRDGDDGPDDVAILSELGDVGWYFFMLAKALGSNVEEVMSNVLAKLQRRAIANKLIGSGDDR